mgnify:FL=1
MAMRWIHEVTPTWDDDKARIVGDAPAGIFDGRLGEMSRGALVAAEWWRVEDEGRTVGFGSLDVVWGDAEILLATAPDARERGVGTFIIEHLVVEARARGLRYVYNLVQPNHPEAERVTTWLRERGFEEARDGRLRRGVSAQGSSN